MSLDIMSNQMDYFGQTGHTPIGVSYVQVTENDHMTLEDKLKTIHCLQELYGFANRRKVLGISDEAILPKWTDEERSLILARKYELEKKQK